MRALTKRWNDPAKRRIKRLDQPALFLTYDDGPNPAITPQLLDILLEFRGSATFFVTGESLDQTAAPAILRRMLEAGHTIGNHGQTHRKDAYPDFETSQLRIEAACGVHTRIFRAPYGLESHVTEYLKRDKHVLAVHWTRHFDDWLRVDLAKAAQQIREAVTPGAIILLHDGASFDAEYRDRSQVLKLTEMIAIECRRRSIPLAGLANVYPALHRIRSGQSKSIGAFLWRWVSRTSAAPSADHGRPWSHAELDAHPAFLGMPQAVCAKGRNRTRGPGPSGK